MLALVVDNCLLHQAKRAVTARLASNVVDIDAAELVCTPLSTIDIAQTSNYNPRDQWAQIESAFQPGVLRYIADAPGVVLSLGLADTQTALRGLGTARLNETILPRHALFLGQFGQFDSSNGDE